MKQRAIVLAADCAYADKVMTTIKSVCAHHSHIKFYLINEDFPAEWVHYLNERLWRIHSQLVDVKVEAGMFYDLPTFHYINYTTFLRYLIPDFVEEDICLYLDPDLIVNGELDDLFTSELGDCYVAVGKDFWCYLSGEGEAAFNAGVMLINNRLWKEENFSKKLIDATIEKGDSLRTADQEILNNVISDRLKWLDDTYNYQVGYDTSFQICGLSERLTDLSEEKPKILHYSTSDKPWQTYSTSRGREIWWHYYHMEWHEILAKWKVDGKDNQSATPQQRLTQSVFTFTKTESLAHIEYLVQQLPHVDFHIAAWTYMGMALRKLARYSNVQLHPIVLSSTVNKLKVSCDAYLDINFGWEEEGILSDIQALGKPIYAFENTAHGEYGQILFPEDRADEMVKALEEFTKNI